MALLTPLLWLIALLAGGWLFRFLGQKIPWPREWLRVYFRDMSYLVGFGFALGIFAFYWTIVIYFDYQVKFFQWAVQGLIIFAAMGYAFRLLGRHVGTSLTKKLFRQMPVTAAFGLLIILIYVVVAVFADVLAPYGQAEVFDRVNVLPGGNPDLGGDPRFLLGTDQAWAGSSLEADLRRPEHGRNRVRDNVSCLPDRHHGGISRGHARRLG